MGTRRFRQINFIRTDKIEGKIALATAKRDYAAIEIWREVARETGAPVRQAENSAADPTYSTEAAITAKLAEWAIRTDSATGRGFNFAVIYYQEEIAARNDFLLIKLQAQANALQRLSG